MKKITIIIGGIIIAVVVLMNIWNQFNTLNEAKKQNLELEKKVAMIKEENNVLEQKIVYATDSAYIEEEIRNTLGLGNDKDIWLKLSPENKDLNLFPKVNEAKEEAKIRQWISLFTR